jgi:hypothetical protein
MARQIQRDTVASTLKPVIAPLSGSVGETTVNEVMAELAKLCK